MSQLKVSLYVVIGSAVVLMSGCASFNSLDSNIIPPTLIEKASLPQPPPSLAGRDFFIKMEILVGKDGAVKHVVLVKSSSDSNWDAAAVKRIMQWKYSPPLLDNKPIRMRIIQTAKVVSSPPIMMNLSEIAFATSSQADSAQLLLNTGAPFDSVASIYRGSVPIIQSGHLGEVDIHQFPEDIQDELRRLEPGRITYPLPLGPYWAIFKRH